jgi:hypothetical protein
MIDGRSLANPRLLQRAVWPTRQHARAAIFRYIEGFYNASERRHSGSSRVMKNAHSG